MRHALWTDHQPPELSALIFLAVANSGAIMASLAGPAHKALGALTLLALAGGFLAALSWITSREW